MTCGICGSNKIGGGSWTPDRCLNCGAMEAGDQWYYDKTAKPTIKEIQDKSGYNKGDRGDKQ